MESMRELRAGPDDAGRRLDRILKRILNNVPLSAIYGNLRKGRIRLNGKKASPETRVAEGDSITIAGDLGACGETGGAAGAGAGAKSEWPERTQNKGRTGNEVSEKAAALLSSLILADSGQLLFLNKPRGIPTHGEGGLDRLVQDALAAQTKRSLAFSPGPLHRLDRNTSGIICFSETIDGARRFTEALRGGHIRKFYLALVTGRFDREQCWKDWLVRDEEKRMTFAVDGPEFQKESPNAASGRDKRSGPAFAEAAAFPLIAADTQSLVLVQLKTGLTHQIRVQAARRGYPLAGDRKYSGMPAVFRAGCEMHGTAGIRADKDSTNGYMLHAWNMVFKDEVLEELPRRIEAPLADAARERLDSLFGASSVRNALETGRSLIDKME